MDGFVNGNNKSCYAKKIIVITAITMLSIFLIGLGIALNTQSSNNNYTQFNKVKNDIMEKNKFLENNSSNGILDRNITQDENKHNNDFGNIDEKINTTDEGIFDKNYLNSNNHGNAIIENNNIGISNSAGNNHGNAIIENSNSGISNSAGNYYGNGIIANNNSGISNSAGGYLGNENFNIFYNKTNSLNNIDNNYTINNSNSNSLSALQAGKVTKTSVINTSNIVVEQVSGRVLSGSNIHAKLPMASTTKVVTALVVLENCDINTQFVIPKEAVGIEGSSIYLQANQVWTIRDLLYGLMLRSGNDSAVALAIACGGTVQNFVQMMNKKAVDMGLKNTNFCNPNGLHDDNHYTSAYDLAIMSCEAMANKDFRDIVATKVYTVPANETHPTYHFGNKNKMLTMYDGGNGIKTGYTKKAGRCLVSSSKRNGLQLVCVVLNVGDMWQHSMDAMTNAHKQYTPVILANSNTTVLTLKTNSGEYNFNIAQEISYPLKSTEKVKFNFDIVFDNNLSLPIAKGQTVGRIDIYNDKRLIFSKKISSMEYIQDKEILHLLDNYVGELEVVNTNGKTKQIFSIKRNSFA